MAEEQGNVSPNSTKPKFEATLEICNKRGLHARASAKFVKCVESYDAQIIVTKDNQTVFGSSIMGLMMMAAARGSSIHVKAEGREAQQALTALTELINDKFGEEE